MPGRHLRPPHDLRHLQPGGAGGGRLRAARRNHSLRRRAELFHDGVDVLLASDPADAEELAGRAQLLMDAAARRPWETPPGRWR